MGYSRWARRGGRLQTLILGESWIVLALACLGAVAMVLGMARTAGSYPGDYRLLEGQIVVWPDESTASRVVVVRGREDGQLYFVRVPAGTSGATGLTSGRSVAIVGREETTAGEIFAISMRPTTVSTSSDATPGWRVVTGTVESVSGSTAILSGRTGRWAVDVSALNAADQVRRGEEVTVVGRVDGSRLIASGIARDTDSPSALPR